MKATIIATLLIYSSFNSIAQVDSSIAGIWKIVSIEIEGVYFNFKNDSISFTGEFSYRSNDTSARKNIINSMKLLYSGTQFHFGKDSLFNMMMANILVDGYYKVFASQQLIEIKTKDSFDKYGADKITYNIKNRLLYLSYDWDEEQLDLVLEKEY